MEPGGGSKHSPGGQSWLPGGGNAPLILEGGWSERRPPSSLCGPRSRVCGGGEAERGPQGRQPTVGSAPYPGVRAQGRGAGPPLSGAGLWPGMWGVPAVLWGPWASCAPRAPKPTWSQGPQGHLNPSHRPGLPAAPKAAQSSVLRFQSSTAHLSVTGHPGQLSLEARPVLTGVCPRPLPPCHPSPELPLTLWLPRTARLGGAPTDDSGESSGLSP